MSVFRVTEPFAFNDAGGVQRVFVVGDLVADDSPIIRGREAYFEPVEALVRRQAGEVEQAFDVAPVEQATAAPGEVRRARRGGKDAAADADD